MKDKIERIIFLFRNSITPTISAVSKISIICVLASILASIYNKSHHLTCNENVYMLLFVSGTALLLNCAVLTLGLMISLNRLIKAELSSETDTIIE